jgi:ABC-type lipoprotein release transport system permease subunit
MSWVSGVRRRRRDHAIADNLGIVPVTSVPWLVIALLVPAALLLALNLIAAVPARRAARTRPAVVLRSE